MTNTCPTTPFEIKNSPYTNRQSMLTKKTSPYTNKQLPYAEKQSPYGGLKTYCPVLLQENRYPLLLENGDMILL